MHAFIPCSTRDEAGRLLAQLASSKIERYLRSLSMEGTCNWAQPGRIKRFLKFVKQEKQVAPELPLFATAVPLLRRKLGLESPIEKLD